MNTKILNGTLQLVPKGYRKKGLLLATLLVVHSVLDFFSLAVFFPVLVAIVNPEVVVNNRYIAGIYDFFDFDSHSSFVITLTTAVFAFLLLRNVFSIWIAGFKSRYAYSIGRDLAANELLHYMQMSYAHFSKTDFSKELGRITNYPTAFAHNILLPLMSLLSEGLVSAMILLCIAIFDIKVLMFLVLILIPIIGLYQLRKRNLERISDELKEKYPLLVKYALRVIEGYSEIRVYGRQLFFKQQFQQANQGLTNANVKDQVMQSATIRLAELVVGVVVCFLIIYSVFTGRSHQETLFLLGVYAGSCFRMIPSINRIMLSLQQIRIHEFILMELTRVVPQVPHGERSDKIPFHEAIELKNISFSYSGGLKTLHHASLIIKKGDKVAITGRSGEGKTTILLILLRFLKESSGEILMDGKPIPNENQWLRLIGYVPQSPYILDASLLENVAFGITKEKADRKKIEMLMHELNLTDLLEQLPNGIDTTLGERGVQLSGGQRQRIAIARALYADAEILLLDEVTNQVHDELEQEIWRVLDRQAAKGKTILVITHKLSSAAFFDSIYRLQHGKLYEAALQS